MCGSNRKYVKRKSNREGEVSSEDAGEMADRPFEAPFRRGTAYSGDRLLFRSKNFTVRGQWESVVLERRGSLARLVIGKFRLDPVAAVINEAETWCVMIGWGLIAYKLAPPWEEYVIGNPGDNWWEFGKGDPSGPMIPFERLDATTASKFVATTTPSPSWQITCVHVDVESREVSRGRSWIDDARRLRSEVLDSLVGMRLMDVIGSGSEITIVLGPSKDIRIVLPGTLFMRLKANSRPINFEIAIAMDPIVDKIRELIGRPIQQVLTREDGILMVGVSTGHPKGSLATFRIYSAAENCWEVSTGQWTIRSPGPAGWPTESC
jgi:hypothetical protein